MAQGARLILGAIAPAPLQFRHHRVDHRLQVIRHHRVGEVEAVDAGGIQPLLQLVGNLHRRPQQHRATPAQADELRRLAHGPAPVRVRPGKGGQRRAPGIVLDVLDQRIRLQVGKIDPGPARQQGQRRLDIHVLAVLVQPGLGRFARVTHDQQRLRVYQHLAFLAPGLARGLANAVHIAAQYRLGRAADEHAFGVGSGKALPACRGAGLEQHRGALWRWFAQVHARHLEVRTGMPDRMHPRRLHEHPAGPVADHRIVVPALLPQLVEHLQVLLGQLVTLVVGQLPGQPQVARGAVQVAGDDVPAHPPVAQVIEGRHAPGERVRVLIGEAEGDAEAQVLGDPGHGRHDQQRIVHRYLHAAAQGCVVAALVHVVHAQHIRDEQRVETSAFQQPGQPGPVAQAIEIAAGVAWVAPQPRRLVRGGVHAEGVETDGLGHARIARGQGSTETGYTASATLSGLGIRPRPWKVSASFCCSAVISGVMATAL